MTDTSLLGQLAVVTHRQTADKKLAAQAVVRITACEGDRFQVDTGICPHCGQSGTFHVAREDIRLYEEDDLPADSAFRQAVKEVRSLREVIDRTSFVTPQDLESVLLETEKTVWHLKLALTVLKKGKLNV